ncbi:MAG: SOS response-associated peptidase family protein [Pseudomonadota bacterium]
MTRLYRLDASAARIASTFGARVGEDPWQEGYVAPNSFAPVVTAGREFIAGPRPANRALEPRIVPRLWGVLPPPNSDDPSRRISSVRNIESPFWIGNLRNSEFRCLIPATAFMLWGAGTDYEGRRIKHWFALEDAPIFAIAGVWKDEDVPAFAMLTQQPSGIAKALGAPAMPVLLPPDSESHQTWLHSGWDRARELVRTATQAALIEIDRIEP